MTQGVIIFDRVSKHFKLQSQKAQSFQEIFVGMLRRQEKRDFRALKEVSFKVERGETLGIIGTNGSGKSTILKLSSRIIEPSGGRIEVEGRLSALLELGAGFHPDLTGRENIYLNGSILGFDRKHMQKNLERIVEFAGLGDFIDMPVRSYSSGMYMRLGFSVAIHVEPKILLVDEVLAVGDRTFQEKCFYKIDELREQQTTIVFVSHDLQQVEKMCDRVMWLHEGNIRALGEPAETVEMYRAWNGNSPGCEVNANVEEMDGAAQEA